MSFLEIYNETIKDLLS